MNYIVEVNNLEFPKYVVVLLIKVTACNIGQ